MDSVINNRTTKIISFVLAVIFGVLVLTMAADAASTISTNISTGGTLSVTGASTLTGNVTASGDVTIGGGNLTVTTSNSATSTIEVGCIQMYATSTATALRVLFHASSTISSVVSGHTASGYVIWGYGSCPI